MKSKKRLKLSATMLAQIASYADDCEQTGWYYGNKERFWKRHEAIKAWLRQELARESDMLAVHGITIRTGIESAERFRADAQRRRNPQSKFRENESVR